MFNENQMSLDASVQLSFCQSSGSDFPNQTLLHMLFPLSFPSSTYQKKTYWVAYKCPRLQTEFACLNISEYLTQNYMH